jgi:hypothetical protein
MQTHLSTRSGGYFFACQLLDRGIFGFFKNYVPEVRFGNTPLLPCGRYIAILSKVLQNTWCGYETVFTGKLGTLVN